jgi:hypothetical protein
MRRQTEEVNMEELQATCGGDDSLVLVRSSMHFSFNASSTHTILTKGDIVF